MPFTNKKAIFVFYLSQTIKNKRHENANFFGTKKALSFYNEGQILFSVL